MTGSATTFQAHYSVQNVMGQQPGKKYLFSLRATRMFSCSDVQTVTRSLDDFQSERKAEPAVFDRPQAGDRDCVGVPRKCSLAESSWLRHSSCPTHKSVGNWCGRRDLNSRTILFR